MAKYTKPLTKVIKGLHKASKLHAGQADKLEKSLPKKRGSKKRGS